MSRLIYHRHRRLRHAPTHHPAGELPRALHTIAWSRATRWVGWGFGESLIPVFIYSFSNTYAEAGLIRSVFEIALLVCFPIAGVLADRMPAQRLILVGLLVYPLVGIGYVLAGITGLALFIIVARVTNALGWALESTGVDTYYRRLAHHEAVNASFGYLDTIAGSGWVIAALIGMLLVPFVPIHILLFLVTPTSVLAWFIARRAPQDPPRIRRRDVTGASAMHPYRAMLVEWKSWNGNLRLLSALSFFVGIIEALIWFFIPIDAYVDGANLSSVILLTVVASIPPMFGYRIGRFADRRNPYVLIASCLAMAAVILVLIAVFPQYTLKLLASFLLGILLECLAIIMRGLVTTLGPSTTYGRRGGTFAAIGDLGDIAAPLVIGITLDAVGFSGIAFIVAAIALIMGSGFALLRPHYAVTNQ